MPEAYLSILRTNWRSLVFGAALMGLSSFGQTYYVALFGAHLRAEFGLSDGGLGAIYAAGTTLSALTLTWAGRLIDRTTVRAYSLAAGGLLAFACVLLGLAPSLLALGLAFYLLRLGGQGLLVHTALTATARAFPNDAGKALGVIALGFAAAQAVFPSLAVMLIGAFGWRGAWLAGGALALLGVSAATLFLPSRAQEATALRARTAALSAVTRGAIWRDRRFLLALPAVLASPFFGTGFFFHQARLVSEKGWTLEWLAGWFVAYAAVQALAVVAAGPLIDKLGPRRMLPVFLAPFALGLVALALSDSPWIAPLYLVLAGISAAVASTLATALWVELYGPEMLARVRSAVEAALIVASGASPILMGLLIDRGVSLSLQAWGAAAYMAAASLLATRLKSQRIPEH